MKQVRRFKDGQSLTPATKPRRSQLCPMPWDYRPSRRKLDDILGPILFDMVDIFVSHSSADKDLVEVVREAFAEVGVNGYFAEFKMEGKPVPEKLRDAIRSSQAVVVFWTHNVSNVPKTRDVVNAEIGEAHKAGKPVYVFREEGTEVPLMLSHITDYFTFSVTTVGAAVGRLKGFLHKYRQDEDFWRGVGIAVAAVAAVGAIVGLAWLLSSSKKG